MGLALVVSSWPSTTAARGLIADVALMLNGLLILAGLALFNATLTLPGIAGFVLTLGMAVDANVLINERIREELRAGKSAARGGGPGLRPRVLDHLRRARHHADRRLHPLLHGNRPVRGFATALIIGLIASMFTSIVVTRVITTYFVHGRNAQTVSV